METSVKPVYAFYNVFLYSIDSDAKKMHPFGTIQLHLANGTGEVICRSCGPDNGVLEFCLQEDGQAKDALAYQITLQNGEGRIAVQNWDIRLLSCKILVEFVRSAVSPMATQRLYGSLQGLVDFTGTPGNYLWKSNAEQFPQLLGQMMNRVEQITQKVTELEKCKTRRGHLPGNTIPGSTIHSIEPFKPPLPKYKWWRLGM